MEILGLIIIAALLIAVFFHVKKKNQDKEFYKSQNEKDYQAPEPIYDLSKPIQKHKAPEDTDSVPENIQPASENLHNDKSGNYTREETHHVAGVTHYQNNIIDLCEIDEDWLLSKNEFINRYSNYGERFYKYGTPFDHSVELVPDPDNPYDKNAIEVRAEGSIIGHIKKGSCTHVHNILKQNNYSAVVTIKGGPYKYIEEDYEQYGKYNLETVNDYNLFATVKITYK